MSENFNGGKAMDNRQNPDVQEQQVYGQTIQEQQIYGQPSPKLQTKHTENLKKHFGILGPACVLYSCFYALCLYKNGGGIAYSFFLAGSLWFYCFCLKKLEISLKKDSAFYIVSILLLGLSAFCTADERIIAMNRAGVWVLTISFLLHQFYKDRNWTFGRYVGYVIITVFGSLGEIARPFQDLSAHRRSRGKKGRGIAIYIFTGIILGIPLFCVIWLLLMSADTIFYNLTYDITEKLLMGTGLEDCFGVLLMIIFMFFFGLLYHGVSLQKDFFRRIS